MRRVTRRRRGLAPGRDGLDPSPAEADAGRRFPDLFGPNPLSGLVWASIRDSLLDLDESDEEMSLPLDRMALPLPEWPPLAASPGVVGGSFIIIPRAPRSRR